MLDIIVSFPPSQGSYYSYNKRVKYITKSGKKYLETVAAECLEQCAYGLKMSYPLDFTAIFYPPTKRIWDFDNHLKALQDSLTKAGVWTDDSDIAQLHCYQGTVVSKGKVSIRIKEGGPRLPYSEDGIAWAIIDDII